MSGLVKQLRVVVEAKDYEEAVAFYRDTLGLPEEAAFSGPDGAEVTILDAGRATLELANPAQHAYIDEVEVGRPAAGHVRVAFEVDDSAGVADQLVESGAVLVAPPTRTPWESLNARLDGPAGLHLSLFQELGEPVLAPEYPVKTERLALRPLDVDRDLDDLHAYLSREDVCRYIPAVPRDREQLRKAYIPAKRPSVLRREGEVLCLAVEHEGRLIGDIVLFWHSKEQRSGEIGYAFNPEFHGRGFATETARALLGLAFDGLGLHRVTARVDERNTASARVIERLGMRKEAVEREAEWFKGEWTTMVHYAMLEDEWRDRR
ncbi:GNAT family N-acetyltransferase [Nocardioides albus]|uniref:RimJ/RimL family protein N-acetyltransferase/predicted enzyme related to lactoylglutathione lyase n=1 Tax=Nocardioides albus TaxID=1841 RepID=A0A7W5F9K5_9ACTN|nr:GNAT family N-acetyltransferase [Nocardioides albus]MBB3090161.1 RimJ/RimL family protein N-acetyltransferase/predicted enzyme related to lactoylglutathione lyase [Nocardioides albus]